MSVHFPVERLVSGAMFGFADLLGMQSADYLSILGAAGLGEHGQ